MILDIDKMKSDDSIKIKLPDQVMDKFIQNSCEYFATLEKDISKINPNNAVDVVSALTLFAEYFSSQAEWERITLHTLELLKKGIDRSFFHEFANFSGMSHVGFSVKDLAAKVSKVQPFLHGINKMLLENLSAYLAGSDKKEFKTDGNFEVIKGLSGPLRYLLCFDDDQMMDMAGRIVDVFVERSKDIEILGELPETRFSYHLSPEHVI